LDKPSKNEFGISVALSYAYLIINALSGLIIAPFIMRKGTHEYGLYMLIISIYLIFNVEGLGIGGVIIRSVKKHRLNGEKRELENFLFVSFVIFAVFAVLSLLIFYIIGMFAEILTDGPGDLERFKTMLLMMALTGAAMFLANYFVSAITGYERFLFVRWLILAKIIFRTFLFIFTVRHIEIETLVLFDLLITLVTLLICALYAFIKLRIRIRPHFWDGKLFADTFRKTGFIFVSLVTDNACWQSGSLIIAASPSLGVDYVGLFTLAVTLSSTFTQLSTVISGIFLPGIVEKVVKNVSGKDLLDYMIRAGRYLALPLALIITGFAFVGPGFLQVYSGGDFAGTYYIAVPLMLSQFYFCIQFIGDNVMQAMNKFNARSAILLTSSLSSVILSCYLTPKFPIEFSWVGIVISTVVFRIFVTNWYYHRKLGLDMIRFFLSTVPRLLFSVAVTVPVLLLFFYLTDFGFVVKGIAVVVVYVAASAFIYVNKSERKTVLGLAGIKK